MISFLQNNWGSLLVGFVLIAAVIVIIIKLAKDKKAGKHLCGGDCKSCGGNCSACHSCNSDKHSV